MPAIAAATIVRGDDLQLTGSWSPSGAVVDQTAPGWYLPIDSFAVDPSSYASVVAGGEVVATALTAPDSAVLGQTSAQPAPRRGRVDPADRQRPPADGDRHRPRCRHRRGRAGGLLRHRQPHRPDHPARRPGALHRRPRRSRTGRDVRRADGGGHPLPGPGRDHLPAPRRRGAARRPWSSSGSASSRCRPSAGTAARDRPGVGGDQHRRGDLPVLGRTQLQPPDRARCSPARCRSWPTPD